MNVVHVKVFPRFAVKVVYIDLLGIIILFVLIRRACLITGTCSRILVPPLSRSLHTQNTLDLTPLQLFYTNHVPTR